MYSAEEEWDEGSFRATAAPDIPWFYYILISAVKRLITINCIQNISFCLHMCYTVHIYYVYINTHTYSIYFENISMYIFIFI